MCMHKVMLIVLGLTGSLLFSDQQVLGTFHKWNLFSTRMNLAEHTDGSLQLGRDDLASYVTDKEIYLSFENRVDAMQTMANEVAYARVATVEDNLPQFAPEPVMVSAVLPGRSSDQNSYAGAALETVFDASGGFRSGLFRGGPGLPLRIREDAYGQSMFVPYAQWHGLTIAFHLKVFDVYEGAEVFTWEHIPTDIDVPVQSIRIFIRNGVLVWEFQNIVTADGEYQSINLTTDIVIIPKTWQSYQLSIDMESARMQYHIDGRLVAVEAITNQEKATVSAIVLPGNIHTYAIGNRYTGLIDEFLISPRSYPYAFSQQRWKDYGVVVSDIIDLGEASHRLNAIEVDFSKSEQAAATTEYRFSSRINDFETLPWQDIPHSIDFHDAPMGRFIQFRITLYADQRSETPMRLTQVGIYSTKKNPLPPPTAIRVDTMDSVAYVQWNAVAMSDLGGYILYLSEDPNLHHSALKPLRVIDVGNSGEHYLRSLKHGRAYFLALGAYRTGEQESLLQFSDPVQFRFYSKQ